MRVLLVSTFPPRRCGIGDYTADLARALAQDGSLDITILTYSDGVQDGVTAEGPLHIDRRLQWARSPRRLASILRDSSPDIVHVQSATFLHPVRVNAVLARTALPCPLVATVHDAPSTWRVFYTIPALREIYRRSLRLFVHSDQVVRALVDFHGIERGKAFKIPHGVDTTKYRPDADPTKARNLFGLQGKRIVLFFGFLRPGKGIPGLMRAWSNIYNRYPDAVLVIAGGTVSYPRRYKFLLADEGSYPGELLRLAHRLGIENHTVFTGYVPEATLPSLLTASDIVVLPYDGSAPQSGPLHKALSSGRPVIATSVPATTELLEERQAAFLVPPRNPAALSDAIGLLLEDSALSRDLGARAREFARDHLDWANVAKKTCGVYKSLGM